MFLKLRRSLSILVSTVVMTFMPAALMAAPAFRAVSAIAASTGADITITVNASCATNDIMLLFAWVRDTDDTAQADATGDSWEQLSTACTTACTFSFQRNTSRNYWMFWERHDGSIDTTVVFNKSGATADTYGWIVCYSGAITTGNPFDVEGTWAGASGDPTNLPSEVTIATADSLLVLAIGGEDNNNAGFTITASGACDSDPTEHYVESQTGGDGAVGIAEAVCSTTGGSNSGSAHAVTWDTAFPGAGAAGVAVALKSPPPPACGGSSAIALLGVGCR